MKRAVFLGIATALGMGLVASTATAQPSDDRDYIWLVNRLRSEGISASSIQWSNIENQCAPLKLDSVESYQQCRLEKARLQADFRDDSTTCNDTASAFNPVNLRYRAVLLENESPPQSETTLTLLNTSPAVADTKAFHRHLFNQCMQGLGWRNPRDYRRGRTD